MSSIKYSLYLYHEGWRNIGFNVHLKKLNDISVLHIPGNGGSYKQGSYGYKSGSYALVSGLVLSTNEQDTILSNDEDIRIDIEDEHIFYIKALPMAAGSPSTKCTASSEFKYEIIFMLDPVETSATEMVSGNKGKDKINIEGATPSNKIVLPQSPPAKRSLFQNPDEQPKTANKKAEKIVGDKYAAAAALKKLL